MANSPRLPASTANSMLSLGFAGLAASGTLNLYTGVQPASGGGSLSGNTLLLSWPLSSTPFGAPAGGVMALAPVPAAVASATGTAAWFRILASDGATVVMDGSVGTTGCDLNLATTAINTGDIVGLTGFTVTVPLQ